MAALAAAVVLWCAPADAQTVGYLYSAAGSSIEQFDVAGDTSLTLAGSIAGGPATPEYPSSVVMAKTAGGENLYQLAGSGKESIYQYSVDPTTGSLSAKSPATVGSIPVLASEESHFMAVFNPAASGAAGQNAVYVLSGPNTEHAVLYMFDIDAVTGALTVAGEIPIPGMRFGEALAYSGNTLVVTGSSTSADEGFQSATIDPTSGLPIFANAPDAPCPGLSCDDGALAMANPDEMLSYNLVEDPNAKVPGTYVNGVSAYEVGGGWGNNGSFASHRPGPGALTSNGLDYFGTEAVALAPFELEVGEFQTSEYGDSWIEEFAPEGGSEGSFMLPEKSGVPDGVLALGSGLYVSEQNYAGSGFATGYAYRLSPPEVSSTQTLGAAMAGYLLPVSETIEPVNGGGTPGGSPAGSAPSGAPPLKLTPGVPVVKLPPPNTKIVSIKVLGTKVTIKFKGVGGVGKLTFLCKLGNAKKSTPCHSPLKLGHLAEGKHRFAVYAVDSRPVADPTPAKISFRTK